MNSIKHLLENLTKNKSHIYIIPTKSGFKFLFINFLLFIIALSFANNMALIITFIMTSYFIIQMLETHRIIHDLKFNSIQIQDQFYLDKNTLFCDYLSDTPELVQLELQSLAKQMPQRFYAEYQNTNNIYSHHYKFSSISKDIKRGYFHLERIKFSTLGLSSLFYVWCYKSIDLNFYLYPSPKAAVQKDFFSKSKNAFIGDLDFEEHKKYVEGEDAQRIDWKLFAKNDSLYKKEYIFEDEECVELHLERMSGNIEEKLCLLSFYIKTLYRSNRKWKLILPNKILEKSQGKNHYRKSMEAISVC